MAIKWKHDDSNRMYFCTFTCYDWLWLFEIVNGYDLVYSWFDVLKTDVFTDSFDVKGVYSEKFFYQKLNYIHLNPVSGKWHLVGDYTKYEHSSASFYETGEVKRYGHSISGFCRG